MFRTKSDSCRRQLSNSFLESSTDVNKSVNYLYFVEKVATRLILMDPWTNSDSLDRDEEDNLPDEDLRFEDNFKPDSSISEHLPDSEEYLAILESKLERIRKDPDLIKQLSDKREACMHQLLSSSSPNGNRFYEEDPSLEGPANNSALIRTIAPQRAALNQGEIVELIKYDQLINQSDDENEKQLT